MLFKAGFEICLLSCRVEATHTAAHGKMGKMVELSGVTVTSNLMGAGIPVLQKRMAKYLEEWGYL
jgi:hypothetical protein